jgi:hypothetical protein
MLSHGASAARKLRTCWYCSLPPPLVSLLVFSVFAKPIAALVLDLWQKSASKHPDILTVPSGNKSCNYKQNKHDFFIRIILFYCKDVYCYRRNCYYQTGLFLICKEQSILCSLLALKRASTARIPTSNFGNFFENTAMWKCVSMVRCSQFQNVRADRIR